MAKLYAAILSIILLLLSTVTISVGGDDGGYAGVVNDHFIGLSPRAGSRFLAGAATDDALEKGRKCDPVRNNICPGTPAKNNTQLLQCCKTHCRDVLTDRNNCGACGSKCAFGQLCCKGLCTGVSSDINNCGKCGKVCKAGVRCEHGTCGYA